MSEPSPPSIDPDRRRRSPIMWIAPLLALIALGSWAFASPVGSSPDDDYHLASIWCAAGDRTSLCEDGPTEDTRYVSESLLGAACFARDPAASGACQEGTFDDRQLVESNRGNFAGQYPPVFYSAMSVIATDDVQTSVLIMRIANTAVLVAMVTALAILLPTRHRPALLWSWLISVIPLGLFLLASINPSAWAVIGVGCAWIALLGYFDASGRRRVWLGVLFVIAMVMALGSRADAAIYFGLTVAAVVFLRFRPDRTFLRLAILPALSLVSALVALMGSRQVGVAINGFDESTPVIPDPAAISGVAEQAVPAGSTLGLIFSNLANAPSLWAGVLGSWGLGWFDTQMPYVVSLGGVGVFAAVVFLGIGVISWRKALITAAAAAALWVIPVWTLTRGGHMVGVELQPRYLLPLIVVLAGFALLAVGVRIPRLTLLQRTLVVGTSAVTQSLALFYTLRRFITGDDVNGFDLGADSEWWWTGVPGPMIVWALGTLSWAGMVVLVVRFIAAVPDLREPEPIAVEPTR